VGASESRLTGPFPTCFFAGLGAPRGRRPPLLPSCLPAAGPYYNFGPISVLGGKVYGAATGSIYQAVSSC